MFFLCFIPEYDAVLHARIIAKIDCSLSPFIRFWARNVDSYPPFLSPLHPKLHLCTHVLMPGTPFPHTPKPHLGYFMARLCFHIGICFTPLFVYVFPTFGQKDACKTQVHPLFERGNSCLNVTFYIKVLPLISHLSLFK